MPRKPGGEHLHPQLSAPRSWPLTQREACGVCRQEGERLSGKLESQGLALSGPGLLLGAWAHLALKSSRRRGEKVSLRRGRLQATQTKRDKRGRGEGTREAQVESPAEFWWLKRQGGRLGWRDMKSVRINQSFSRHPSPTWAPPSPTELLLDPAPAPTNAPARSLRTPQAQPDIWLSLRSSRSRSARRAPPPPPRGPPSPFQLPAPSLLADKSGQTAGPAGPAATAALPNPAELGAPGGASSPRATSPRLTCCPRQDSARRTLPSALPAPRTPNLPAPPQRPRPARSFLFP